MRCGTIAIVCVTLCAGCGRDVKRESGRSAASAGQAPQSLAAVMRGGSPTANSRKLPVPIKRVAADIPDALRPTTGIGTVTVKLTIDEQGSVVDASVEESTVPKINDRIVATCRQWKFEPSGVRQEFYVHQQISPVSGAPKKHGPRVRLP